MLWSWPEMPTALGYALTTAGMIVLWTLVIFGAIVLVHYFGAIDRTSSGSAPCSSSAVIALHRDHALAPVTDLRHVVGPRDLERGAALFAVREVGQRPGVLADSAVAGGKVAVGRVAAVTSAVGLQQLDR
jgi:hypothetical protein